MTDRELLEKAAKACGLPECGWMGPAFMYVKDNTFTDWNPLTDNADAFSLAVVLRLNIDCTGYSGVQVTDDRGNGIRWPVVDDRAAATRRAIVRAAAALDKTAEVPDN